MSTEHHESIYAVITHTNNPLGGVKRSFLFFSESGHVAYQSKVEEVLICMQVNTLNLHTILASEVGFKGQILKLCRCKYICIELSTKTYLTGVCYDLNDTVGDLKV